MLRDPALFWRTPGREQDRDDRTIAHGAGAPGGLCRGIPGGARAFGVFGGRGGRACAAARGPERLAGRGESCRWRAGRGPQGAVSWREDPARSPRIDDCGRGGAAAGLPGRAGRDSGARPSGHGRASGAGPVPARPGQPARADRAGSGTPPSGGQDVRRAGRFGAGGLGSGHDSGRHPVRGGAVLGPQPAVGVQAGIGVEVVPAVRSSGRLDAGAAGAGRTAGGRLGRELAAALGGAGAGGGAAGRLRPAHRPRTPRLRDAGCDVPARAAGPRGRRHSAGRH